MIIKEAKSNTTQKTKKYEKIKKRNEKTNTSNIRVFITEHPNRLERKNSHLWANPIEWCLIY